MGRQADSHHGRQVSETTSPCEVPSIVLGGYVNGHDFNAYVKNTSSFRWEDKLTRIMEGKYPRFPKDAVPIAEQIKDIALATHMFKDLSSKEPYTGFHAILLFGTLCRSLNLYGFGGSGTADNHEMSLPIAYE